MQCITTDPLTNETIVFLLPALSALGSGAAVSAEISLDCMCETRAQGVGGKKAAPTRDRRATRGPGDPLSQWNIFVDPAGQGDAKGTRRYEQPAEIDCHSEGDIFFVYAVDADRARIEAPMPGINDNQRLIARLRSATAGNDTPGWWLTRRRANQ